MHTLSNISSKRLGAAKIWSAFGGECIYGMFAWNDPLPFLRYSLNTLFPSIAAAALGKIRKMGLHSDGKDGERQEVESREFMGSRCE
jgi:hypothetical protein